MTIFNLTVPGPVQYLEARVRGSNSFSLLWKAPALEDRNGNLLGYDISYQVGEYSSLVVCR